MGFLKSLQLIFTNHSETSDNHVQEQLRSHYYKTNVKKAMQAVKEIVDKMAGFEISSFSEERGEISINVKKGRKAFIVVTVIPVRPFETAIDFSATTETLFIPVDFGYSRKMIIQLYSQLDKKLTFIGAGSGKNSAV